MLIFLIAQSLPKVPASDSGWHLDTRQKDFGKAGKGRKTPKKPENQALRKDRPALFGEKDFGLNPGTWKKAGNLSG
ncbi:MAG: hypothetical protein JJU00_05450 [Opitutales bacterium]|nr:hypothetical protein [Opitutales bacterium]